MSMLLLEPNGYVAIISVIVLAIASLVGLVLFVNKEDTFEDVVAAQKKEQEALLTSLQGGKSGKSKKWNKLKSKKANKKEHGDEADGDSGVDDEEPSSESINAPAPVLAKETPVQTTTKKNKKQKSEKPTQEVKEEAIQKAPIPEQESTPPVAKEKKSKQKKKEVVEENVSVVEGAQTESAPQLPEELPATAVEESKVQKENPKEKKPSKTKSNIKTPAQQPKSNENKKGSQAAGELTVKKLMNGIETVQMNSLEVQQIIDILLAKQNEQEQWKKPGQKANPMEQLKKQLSEVEEQLMEEKKTSQSIAFKNKEMRNELQQQRTTIQNQASEKLRQQALEHEKLRKALEDKHNAEIQSTQTQIQRMQELIDGASHNEIHQMKEEIGHLKNASLRAQQLTEDNKSLVNELNQLQQNNKQLRSDLDNAMMQYKQQEQHQNTFKDQLKHYENEIKTKTEQEQGLSNHLQDITNKLAQSEAQNKALARELEVLKAESGNVVIAQESLQESAAPDHLQAELSNARSRLESANTELEKVKQEKHNETAILNTRLTEAEAKVSELDGVQAKLAAAEKNLAEKQDAQAKLGEAETTLADLKLKLCDAEAKLDGLNDLQAKLAEAEKRLAESAQLQTMFSETKAKLAEAEKSKLLVESQFNAAPSAEQKNSEIKKYQDEITAIQKNMTDIIASAQESKDSADNEIVQLHTKNKEQEKELGELKAKLESSSTNEPNSEEVKELKANQVKNEEVLAQMKAKNNELREKNWKAMDALGKSEEESNKKLKKIEQSLMKGLKKLHPSVKITSTDDYDKLFEEFAKSVHVQNGEAEQKNKTEHEKLLKEIEELKKNQSSMEESEKLQSENSHLRGVLLDTEIMLSQLQQNVDAEVAKLQKQGQLKDQELAHSSSKITDLEKLVEANKDRPQIEAKLKEAKAHLEEQRKEMNTLKEQLEKGADKGEVEELNAKLKKTISERDLLIREFKSLKDKTAKLEKEAVAHNAHSKQLEEQLDKIKQTPATDSDKEKLIGKLYLEIEELKEDIQDARDQVIVDIESVEAEDLHRQVDSLAGELQTEKQSKLELSMKLEDLEKSFKAESESDKLFEIQTKLEAAQARIKELESQSTQKVESQIADAMRNSTGTSV